MVVGYPGHFDIFLGKFLCWLRHKPIIWDICLSVYLICLDRGLDKKSKITFAGLHFIEKTASRLPNKILLETQAYIDWFSEHYQIPKAHFSVAPLGADDRYFYPRGFQAAQTDKRRVLFYGTFHGSSGVLHIVEAAKLLAGYEHIHFELVGKGPHYDEVRRRIDEEKLTNIRLLDWMDQESLLQEISQADLCLGSFGTSLQAFVSVHNKIYESLAMAKAVITGDSPAIRESMKHKVHIYLVERANGPAIAEAIQLLLSDDTLRETLSKNGYNLFRQNFTNTILGEKLKTDIYQVLADSFHNKAKGPSR